jgi:hypothetical protein
MYCLLHIRTYLPTYIPSIEYQIRSNRFVYVVQHTSLCYRMKFILLEIRDSPCNYNRRADWDVEAI